jgi:hypothetical protein
MRVPWSASNNTARPPGRSIHLRCCDRLERGEQCLECRLVRPNEWVCLRREQYGLVEPIVWLLHRRQVAAENRGSSHSAERIDGGTESCRVDVVHPRAIDRGPEQLKVANLIASRAYIGGGGQLKRRHGCPEAVRAEQRAGPVVEEAGG